MFITNFQYFVFNNIFFYIQLAFFHFLRDFYSVHDHIPAFCCFFSSSERFWYLPQDAFWIFSLLSWKYLEDSSLDIFTCKKNCEKNFWKKKMFYSIFDTLLLSIFYKPFQNYLKSIKKPHKIFLFLKFFSHNYKDGPTEMRACAENKIK